MGQVCLPALLRAGQSSSGNLTSHQQLFELSQPLASSLQIVCPHAGSIGQNPKAHEIGTVDGGKNLGFDRV